MPPSSRGLPDWRSPPPSTTSTSSSVSSSRSTVARTSVTHSAARRSTISPATVSVSAATKTRGASCPSRLHAILPAWIARASSTVSALPKCSGTSRSSSVFGPRPSALRAAAEMAASPTAPAPSIASPLTAPREGKRTCCPSGPSPTQFIPEPQVTAMPQPRSVPARRTAYVSFPTTVSVAQRRRSASA